MRVLCVHSVSHAGELHEAGSEAELPDEVVPRLVDLGAVVALDAPSLEPTPEEPPPAPREAGPTPEPQAPKRRRAR